MFLGNRDRYDDDIPLVCTTESGSSFAKDADDTEGDIFQPYRLIYRIDICSEKFRGEIGPDNCDVIRGINISFREDISLT